MPIPTHEEIRARLSTGPGALSLTSEIYEDPASWLEPLAHVSRSERGEVRAQALIALATALMPAAVRSPNRIPLRQVLDPLGSALQDPSVSSQRWPQPRSWAQGWLRSHRRSEFFSRTMIRPLATGRRWHSFAQVSSRAERLCRPFLPPSKLKRTKNSLS